MPIYVYRDSVHEIEVVHSMFYNTAVICETCGATMRRVPQAPRVNYGGDTAAHPIHPTIKRLIAEAPQRREKFAKEHEEHERRTASEARY